MKSKYKKHHFEPWINRYTGEWMYWNKRPGFWVYELRSGGYGRGIFRTQQECRENCFLRYDEDLKELNLHVRARGRRAYGNLDAWNVEKAVGRNWRRSWKDFTRHHKQWMTNIN